MGVLTVLINQLPAIILTSTLTAIGLLVAYLVKGFSFFDDECEKVTSLKMLVNHLYKNFLKLKKQCWFCHAVVNVKRSEENCFACPSCGQYNGFTKDGDYNKDIPEMYDESLNHQDFVAKCSSTTTTMNGLCYSCNRNQELKLYQLASFVPVNERDYDRELDEFRSRLESTYRLCVFCEVTVREKLQLQEQWLKKNLPQLHSPKVTEKRPVKLPMVKTRLSLILTVPRSMKLLYLTSATVGLLIASMDLPCFVHCAVLDDVLVHATIDAIRDSLLFLCGFGFLCSFGCLGVASWKHQVYKVDVLLIMMWLIVIGFVAHNYNELHLSCTDTSYLQSAMALVVFMVSMRSATVSRRITIEKLKSPKRSVPDNDSILEQSAGKRLRSSQTLVTSLNTSHSPSTSDVFGTPVQNRKRSPSLNSVSPSDSASQSDRVRPRSNLDFPKPVKLFDGFDDCSIDTGISCLKIGSPHKRNQYFVPKPTNFLNRSGSTVSRSIFSGAKPILSPPKFRPESRSKFWFGSITDNKEYQDFNDFHKFSSSKPVSRSSSQSSGFVSCSDFTERTLVPEYGPPSPSLSRRSSVSDLTEHGYRETESRSRAGSFSSRCSVSSKALVLASDHRELGRYSRLSNVSQEDKTMAWSWVPFVLGFSIAVNVCAAFYVLVLT